MADIEKNENEEYIEPIVLVDEESGEEQAFEVIANATIDDKLYFALVMADDEDADEYVILRATVDGEDMLFETIEDDDEFEKVEDYFNDLLFSEIDYDEE
jgi:uncharacterized protein YrzB (UPF0473 family)